MEKIDKDAVGLAAEFFVLSNLISKGFQSSLTFGHTKSIDIHATKGEKIYAIQVKGASQNKKKTKSVSWRIKKDKIQSTILYVFVNLNLDNNTSTPDFYIIQGGNLEVLVRGKPPQEYIYSKALDNFKDKWPT